MAFDEGRARAGLFHHPGSDRYKSATTPFSPLSVQRPSLVAAVSDADDVGWCLTAARENGLRIVVQATGHAAVADLGDDVLLIDTTDLRDVQVDPDLRRAQVGAGALWSDVQPLAEPHGLLGLAGSTGTVGVAGYSFGGGLGWLTRPHGMASARLLTVDYVDGTGQLRRAAEDAADAVDRDALWAYRGGGALGVVLGLEIELVPVEGMWGGYAFWPADRITDVVQTWAHGVATLGTGLSSSATAMKMPPTPAIPDELQGRPAVRILAVASEGSPTLDELRAVLQPLGEPLLDTFGPLDAARLGELHLDPPGPAAALGDGYWLTGGVLDRAVDILTSVPCDESFPLNFIELRHVDVAPSGVPGVVTTPPGTVLAHANGSPGPEADVRMRTEAALSAFHGSFGDVATGRRNAAFSDGREAVADAWDPDTGARLRAIHDAVDPDGLLTRPASLL